MGIDLLRRLSLNKIEKLFLICWIIWLLSWLSEQPIHRHDFNTAQWLLHSWWFLEEPSPTCLSYSRLSCWYYPTHPPLVHLFGIPGLIFFGWVTWPIRLLQASIVLWGAFELRALARRIANPTAGTMSLFILLASPLLILFAAIPNYEPTVVALLCALMNRTSLYLEKKTINSIIPVFVISILGMLTDWSAYHPVGIAFLIAWYGQINNSSTKWIEVLAEHRWHLTALVITGVIIFSGHLWAIFHAYGSLDPLFSTAERRSFSFSLEGTRVEHFSFLSKPIIAIAIFAGIIIEQFLMLLTAWVILFLSRNKHFPNSSTSIGGWIIIPMSAGIIHTLMFPQGAFIHEYWIAPLLPSFTLLVAVKASNWTEKQVNICGVVGCAMLLLWALIILPLTSVSYVEDSVNSVDGLHDEFGDDASILASSEIVASRPEVVMSLHTGRVTPTHLATDSQDEWNWDGAIICSDSDWISKLTTSEHYQIIDERKSPACDSSKLVVLGLAN